MYGVRHRIGGHGVGRVANGDPFGRLHQQPEALPPGARIGLARRRLDPDLSLRKVRQQNPTTESDFLARWLGGLRKAGLKEK